MTWRNIKKNIKKIFKTDRNQEFWTSKQKDGKKQISFMTKD